MEEKECGDQRDTNTISTLDDDIVLHVTRLLKKDDFLIWFKDDKTIKTSDFICI